MALAVGGVGPLDFDPSSQANGSVVGTAADHVTISWGNGYFGYFWGSFQLNASGQVIGGFVNAYEEVDSGVRAVSVTGINVPAQAIVAAQASGDGLGVLNLLFGGSDSVAGSARPDTILGLDGADTIQGLGGEDDLNGNVGTDSVSGGDGADWVRGGKDNDTIWGDAGSDPHVNGNLGNDLVHGGTGNDTVYGGQGEDQVFGDSGDDYVFGDLGNDSLYGGTGLDILTGGGGADYFIFRPGDGVDGIVDFNSAQGDRVVLTPGTTYTIGTYEGYALVQFGATDAILFANVSPSQLGNWLVFG